MTKNQNPFHISKGIQFRIILLLILLALGLRCILPFGAALAILSLGVVIIGALLVRKGRWILVTMAITIASLFISHWRIEQVDTYMRLAATSLVRISSASQKLEIRSQPTIEDNKTRFDAVFLNSSLPKDFKVKVSLSGSFNNLSQNDVITLKGKAYLPENKEGETFDYVKFLAKDNIFLELRAYGIESHVPSKKVDIFSILNDSRVGMEKVVSKLWPGDVGGLVSGILIGTKSSISQKTSDAFRITGLSHIVAISGFNITIIIVFIFSLLSWIPKSTRIIIAGVFIVVFVIFVGASAAVVRAGIMGIIGLFALYSERKSNILTSLLLSAVGMTIVNPMTLLYDIGFELSFLAVLGLVYGDLFFGFLKKLPEAFGIREALMGTLSAQITTLPITLYYFGSLSVISPLANIIVTPFIPITMLLGFITLLLTFVPFLGFFVFCFQIVTNTVTDLIIRVTHLLASLPFASVEITLFKNAYVLVVSYAVIVVAIVWLQRKK